MICAVAASRPQLRYEKQLLRSGLTRLASMDEVGRGALAGPVTVGVMVVTATIGRVPAGLKDSKLLTPRVREILLPVIQRWAGEYAVGHASPAEIDTVGIMGALRLAGRRALAQLPHPVDAVLLDGNYDYLSEPELTLFSTPVFTRIKADLTCAGVAGASVLAKTERDAMLRALAVRYPEYLFEVNKGYGTAAHVAALRRHGPCELHRRSWRLPSIGDPMVSMDEG